MGKLRRNEAGFSAVEVILVLVMVAFISVVGFMVYKNHNKMTSISATTTDTTKPSTSTEPKTSTTQATSPQEGTITGNASYPSSGLPSDEQVCAVDVSNIAKVYCDSVGARQPANNCTDLNCVPPSPVLKFSVKVPTGDYHVYATAEKEQPNYKAYYDEYSKCGNSVNCPATGHKKYIKVTVTPNATVENADPGDWYAM